MLHIKVCGPGCMNCNSLYNMCQEILYENDIDGFVEKVTDRNIFNQLGIYITPGLVVNNKILSKGKIPTRAILTELLMKESKLSSEEE